MSILEITIVLYLFIGFFLAGQSWEDTDNFYFIIRVFITAFYVVILPITLILGWIWEIVKMCYNPLDSIFQISFYASFYIFNRKKWRNMEISTLKNIYLIYRDKRNTDSLKDRIYRKGADKIFKLNNFTPDENYKKDI